MPKQVCLFVYEGTNFLTLGGLLETFSTLSDIQKDPRKTYVPRVCSVAGGEISGRNGCFVRTESLADHETVAWDTFAICGGWGFDQALKSKRLVAQVAQHAHRAQRVCVLGGGAFIAAAAGLLDGHRVAAHPVVGGILAKKFPRVLIDQMSLLVSDRGLFTSPGMSSAVDLALTMIECDFGRRAAMEVAKYLVVPLKRSFNDPQLSPELMLQEKSDRFGELHDWMRSNLRNRLSIEELAGHAAMSVRNFTRLYHAETGMSPRRAVELVRIYAACRMLLFTKEHIKSVASRCGFGSERTFLRSFGRVVGMSPVEFRESASGDRSGLPMGRVLDGLETFASRPVDIMADRLTSSID